MNLSINNEDQQLKNMCKLGEKAVFEQLKAGRAVIVPTDTVYGLAVSVEHALSDAEIFRIKKRPKNKPVAWLIPDRQVFEDYSSSLNEDVIALAQCFWPGALTIIVQANKRCKPCFVSCNNTIGFRIPNHEELRQLMRLLDSPLATSSANVSGALPVGNFSKLDKNLLSQASAALFDKTEEQKEPLASTVIDCSGEVWIIVREGSITQDDIVARLAQCKKRFGVASSF